MGISSGAPSNRLLSLPCLVIALVCTLVYVPGLKIPLNVRQDDHFVVLRADPNHAHKQVDRRLVSLPALPLRFDLETSGRFRPMFFVGSFLETEMFGADARQLHAWRLLWTFITALLLYRAGVALFASRIAGYAVIPLILLAPDPGPANVWYTIATWCEMYGTVFVLLNLLASSAAAQTRSWRLDALALLFAAGAGASKEPFVLLIPCLLLVRVWLGEKQNPSMTMMKSYRTLAVAYGVLFLVYSSVIVSILVERSDTYGGKSGAAHTGIVAEVIRDLLATPYMSAGMIPVLVMTSRLVLTKQVAGWLRRNWFGLAIVVACMAGQLLAYGTRGGFWDHYWLPYLLAPAALNAGAMAWLWRHGPRRFFTTAASGLLIWSLNGARVNAAATWNFAQKGAVRMEVVEAVAQAIPPSGRVLVVADQEIHSEWSFSVLVFLGYHGREASEVWLYDVGAVDRSTFAEGFGFPHSSPLGEVRSSDFDAIVYLDLPEDGDSHWRGWYDSDSFEQRASQRDLVSVSLRQRRVVRETFAGTYAINEHLRSDH